MNKNTANYETDRPQVAVKNVDFYNDKLPWTFKALVVPALVLVYSIGLPSSAGAIDNSLPKNRPNIAAIKIVSTKVLVNVNTYSITYLVIRYLHRLHQQIFLQIINLNDIPP